MKLMSLVILSLLILGTVAAAMRIAPVRAAGPTINNPTVQEFQSSLQLPTGSQMYIFGMATGGLYNSGTFANGEYASVTNAAGNLAAQLAFSTIDQNSFTTSAAYYVIGGVGVSGFSTFSQTFGSNGVAGAPSASASFSLSSDSLVVVVGLSAAETFLSLSGLAGLQTDAAVINTSGNIPMIIAHANLGQGSYTVTETTSPNSDQSCCPDHFADLIGVFIFSSATGPTIPVTVTILRFIQIQNPDGGLIGDGDYYARVQIDGFGFQDNRGVALDFSTSHVDQSPFWKFSQTVNPSSGTIPIDIQVWDADCQGVFPICGSGPLEASLPPDDIMDLSPIDNVVDLLVSLDLSTCTWTFPRGDAAPNAMSSAGDGDHEHFGINEGGEAGRVFFGIACNSNGDIDGDGIPDAVERFGIFDSNGNQVPFTSGAGLPMDPCRKTIAAQIDFMGGAADGHTHKPQASAINELINAFNNAPSYPAVSPCPYAGFPTQPSGINLVIDVAHQIPEQTTMGFGADFDAIRDANLDPARRPYFHYSLWIHNLSPQPLLDGTSGICCRGNGHDFIVSLGSWPNQVGTVRQQSGTFMHELGHSLGLGHGGSDGINFKANYLSAMSYRFQTVGISFDSNNDGIPDGARLDYSGQRLATLDELALNEQGGIGNGQDFTAWNCPNNSVRFSRGDQSIDWNCNGTIDQGSVSGDINGDRVCVTAGNNGVLETTPGGDDTVSNGQIWDGANRTCETNVGGDDTQVRNSGDVQPNILNGFDDWSNLHFFAGPSFGAGTDITPHRELDFPTAQVIETEWRDAFNIKTSKFFTDGDLNPLPLDNFGNPKVDVVLANGVVRSTNPGQMLAWVNVTNRGPRNIQSLKLNDTLPVDWVISPPWMPAKGAIHVFFANATSLATNPEITQPSTITVSPGPPEIVHLAIPSFNATAIGHPLLKNQSILLSVKLDYGLDGTSPSARNYPLNYTDTANAKAWTMTSYRGTAVGPSIGTGFFTAYAKVVGDVDGDGSVDITDLLLVWQHQFSNNPQYDVNGDGAVDIRDLVITWQYQFA